MIYFDNSATSNPKLDSVINAMVDTMKNNNGNPGRGGHRNSRNAAKIMLDCRLNLAKLLNISDVDQIVFTKNGTEALNIGIQGVLNEKDHVITTVLEHNSVLRPLKKLEKENGLEIDILNPDKDGLIKASDIISKIKHNTRLCIINHVSNVSGVVQDIKAIGNSLKDTDVIFMVDAAQSAGLLEIDVINDNIDIIAAPGHKALLGPQGTGFIYIKKKIKVKNIYSGGTGTKSQLLLQPDIMPEYLESGTVNMPGISGLNEGIKHVLSTKIENIQKRESELLDYFIAKLINVKGIMLIDDYSSNTHIPVVSFNLKNYDPSEIAYVLDKQFDIAVRSGLHCAPLAHEYYKTIGNGGSIRASINHFNNEKEIDEFIEALKNIEEYL